MVGNTSSAPEKPSSEDDCGGDDWWSQYTSEEELEDDFTHGTIANCLVLVHFDLTTISPRVVSPPDGASDAAPTVSPGKASVQPNTGSTPGSNRSSSRGKSLARLGHREP